MIVTIKGFEAFVSEGARLQLNSSGDGAVVEGIGLSGTVSVHASPEAVAAFGKALTENTIPTTITFPAVIDDGLGQRRAIAKLVSVNMQDDEPTSYEFTVADGVAALFEAAKVTKVRDIYPELLQDRWLIPNVPEPILSTNDSPILVEWVNADDRLSISQTDLRLEQFTPTWSPATALSTFATANGVDLYPPDIPLGDIQMVGSLDVPTEEHTQTYFAEGIFNVGAAGIGGAMFLTIVAKTESFGGGIINEPLPSSDLASFIIPWDGTFEWQVETRTLPSLTWLPASASNVYAYRGQYYEAIYESFPNGQLPTVPTSYTGGEVVKVFWTFGYTTNDQFRVRLRHSGTTTRKWSAWRAGILAPAKYFISPELTVADVLRMYATMYNCQLKQTDIDEYEFVPRFIDDVPELYEPFGFSDVFVEEPNEAKVSEVDGVNLLIRYEPHGIEAAELAEGDRPYLSGIYKAGEPTEQKVVTVAARCAPPTKFGNTYTWQDDNLRLPSVRGDGGERRTKSLVPLLRYGFAPDVLLYLNDLETLEVQVGIMAQEFVDDSTQSLSLSNIFDKVGNPKSETNLAPYHKRWAALPVRAVQKRLKVLQSKIEPYRIAGLVAQRYISVGASFDTSGNKVLADYTMQSVNDEAVTVEPCVQLQMVAYPANGGGGEEVTWDSISGKPSTFAPSAHTHIIADVTGLSDALAGKAAIAAAVPIGGAAGTVLTKTSATNYATEWAVPFKRRVFVTAGATAVGALVNLFSFTVETGKRYSLTISGIRFSNVGSSSSVGIRFEPTSLITSACLICTNITSATVANTFSHVLTSAGSQINVNSITPNASPRGFAGDGYVLASSNGTLNIQISCAGSSNFIVNSGEAYLIVEEI